MPQPTRALHPLNFEDLEPHRFEDLTRQLIYGFRQWESLEATGRTGSDEGMDIRAIERLQSSDVIYEDEVADGEPIPIRDIESKGRLWIIQCKRERRISPTRIRSIVSTNFSGLTDKPYGYILVAACDFSKKARDAFREEAVNQGVEEFIIWGKAEVEDQLYLPKNDHLLFAYFGISLQVRRRSVKTEIRAKLSLKKKLTNILGAIDQIGFSLVLIRDPRDERYPSIDNPGVFLKSPSWRYWVFYAHQPPDHLAFIYKKHYAYVDWETNEYDVLSEYDDGIPPRPVICDLEEGLWDPRKLAQRYHKFWGNIVPEANRAWAVELRIIPYERIIALDEIGDIHHQGPHLLVEYGADGQPFEPERRREFLESTFLEQNILEFSDGKRISYFPEEIPEITENLDQ
ncbi:hypothetical protein ACFLWO_03630 [Chloroflexota bacterium]